MRTIYKNGAALVGEELTLWERVRLTVEDGRILSIERENEEGAPERARVCDRATGGENCVETVDLHGALLLPGFVNTHGHLAMTLFRGLGGGLPLQRWLNEVIFPREAELTAEQVALGTRLALAEMIKGGTTAFADMYYFSPQVVEETLAAGLRGNIGRSVCSFDYAGDAAGLPDFAEGRALFRDYNGAGAGRIRCDYALHSIETCTPRFIESAASYAAADGAGLLCHLSETKREVEECIERYHGTPPQVFADCGAFSLPRVVAAHCVHLSEMDEELLLEHGVAISHCPSSNLKLASGFARVRDYLRRGLRVTLGTDGAASNNNLNMFEELHLAALLSKGVAGDATALSAREALQMATRAGALALGFPETGVLKAGMAADFIAVRRDGLHLLPGTDPVEGLVYAAQGADVTLTVASGRILYDGELRTIDEERLRAELRAMAH